MSLQDKWLAWLDKELFVTEFQNPSSSFFSVEQDLVDLTTQSGAPIDTPRAVKFGNSLTTPNGLLSYNSTNGHLTILKTGPYIFKTRARPQRTGSAGLSDTFFWIEISTDNGATFSVLGNAVNIRLSSANESALFFDSTPVYLPTGVILKSMWARSSTGADDVNLAAQAPSAALQALGVPTSPSAQLTLYKSNNWNYV